MKEITEKPPFLSEQTLKVQYLVLDLNPQPDVEFTIVCAGREVCALNYDLKRSTFDYHAIEFVLSGEAELRIGKHRWTLQPGAVFSYSPDTRLQIKSLGKKPLVKYFVDVTGQKVIEKMESLPIAGPNPLWLPQVRWVHDLFDQLIGCASLPKPEANTLATLLIELLFARIKTDSRPTRETCTEAFRTYTRCRTFVEGNFLQFKHAEDVAEACGVSTEYMTRLFRRFSDEPPYKLLVRLRMEHVAELLIRENATVTDAACALGYSDPFHFSRVFKRVHGVSPNSFRTLMRRDT